MAHIVVHKTHMLSCEGVRASIERIAAELGQSLHLSYHWQGDSLHIQGSGVNGRIDVGPSELRVSVRLGLLLLPLKPRLEQQIYRYIDQALGGA